ncbi:hypothetical protein D3C84_1030460 [compost metagenome]
MAATDTGKLFQGDAADNRPLVHGHQLKNPLVVRRQASVPGFGGRKRHLQRLTSDERFAVKRGDAFNVGIVEAFEGDDSVGGGHG